MSDMHVLSSIFIFFVVVCLVTCEESCEVNRIENGVVLREDLIPIRNSSGHQTGTNSIYLQAETSSSADSGSSLYIRCRDPYRFQGDRARVLAKVTCTNGKWVPFPVCLLPPCDKRSLNYGGLEKTGERIYFHGESFEPTCQHGYRVAEKADKKITCENGQWTGNLPPCTKDVQCKLPQKPDFGSVELIGTSAAVGSVVLFTCDAGRKPIGSVVSACNNLGEWTSPTPECVAPCQTETLLDFEGLIVENRRSLDDGEWFQPRCDEGFEVADKDDPKIYCRNGKWEGSLPPCSRSAKASCRTEILGNFEGLIVENRPILDDGDWFQPRCDENFEVAVKDDPKIYCRDGKWEGNLPPCFRSAKAAACETESLSDFEGLIVESRLTLDDGEWFSPRCDVEFEVADKDDPKIYCRHGKWEGNLPPCSRSANEACETQSLSDFEGLIVDSRLTLDDGESFSARCEVGFQVVDTDDPKIYCRNGNWEGNLPPCSRSSNAACETQSLSDFEGLIVDSRLTFDDGESFSPRCEVGFQVADTDDPKIYCRDGNWEGNLPPCFRSSNAPCTTETLLDFEGLIIENRPTLDDGEWFLTRCDEGFQVADKDNPKIYCSDGKWVGNIPPCTPAQEKVCRLPSVRNGYLGRQEQHRRFTSRTFFRRVNVGTTLNEGESLTLRCKDGYIPRGGKNTEVAIFCMNGKLSPRPTCLIRGEPCETESLLGFAGLVLSGPTVVYDGDWIEAICAVGYEFLDKNATTLYCRQGRWEGTLPPCYPAPCLDFPPIPENGRIKPTWWKSDHGARVEYECLRGNEMSEEGSVTCSYGKWTGSLPTCNDKRCHLRNLFHKEGVDLSNDEPVQAFRKANIVCIEGYTLKYPDVRCINGQWQTQNSLSPCQQSGCQVPVIENGEVLKEISIPIQNFWGNEVGTDTVYEEADTGFFENSGTTLHVSCRDPYRFLGGDEELNNITCQKGNWIPLPKCVRSSTCSMSSLYDAIPADIVAYTDDSTRDDSTVPNGFKVKLGCGQFKMVFRGNNTAVCGASGAWSVGSDIQCTHSCDSIRKNSDSELIISPIKNSYIFGESITFSCPEDKFLTEDVERILCLKYGWEPSTIPDCY